MTPEEIRAAMETGEEIEYHLMGNEHNTVPVPGPGWYPCIVEHIYRNGNVEILFTDPEIDLGVTVLKRNIGIAFRRKAEMQDRIV